MPPHPSHFAFVDIAASYHGQSPETEALGGTQSAVCHLSSQLVKKGAKVTFINQNRVAGIFAGIHSLPPEQLDNPEALKDVDVLVMNGRWTKKLVETLRGRTKAKLFGWMHEVCFNDPWILPLPQFDGFVFVSNWQKNINAPLVPPSAVAHVIPNGVAPAFHTLFGNLRPSGCAPYSDGARSEWRILKNKQPIVVYMGSSKRGLFHLPQILPELKRKIPALQFEIYSDCNIDNDDAAKIAMQERLRAIDGVTHIGNVSQAELPSHIARASFFISPNTYPETFCICLAEAMAAGCTPIITARAALPETARGFGAALPVDHPDSVNYEKDALDVASFTVLTTRIIEAQMAEDPARIDAHLRRQIDMVNTHYNWDAHAEKWLAL